MRLLLPVIVAFALRAGPLMAQDRPSQPAAPSTPAVSEDAGSLPVSLDRIRERLAKPDDSRLKNLDVKADFVVHIEEQRHIDEMLSKMDFRGGPAPAGGLYGYEQQRQLFNPVDRPLQQPYAAFSGGEFATIAIQNLVRVFLQDRIRKSFTDARHAGAEADARNEVDQAIAEYCASRSDRDSIELCKTRP